MLTEEQQAQLDALLKKLQQQGVDYDTMLAEYNKLENSFTQVEDDDKIEEVEEIEVKTPKDKKSDTTIDKVESFLNSPIGKLFPVKKILDKTFSPGIERERKRENEKKKTIDPFKVDPETTDIDFDILDKVDFNTFKNSLVVKDKIIKDNDGNEKVIEEYLGPDGKPYEKVLDAYQSAIYAQKGLDFEKVSKFEKDLQEAEVFFKDKIISKEDVFTRTGKAGQRIDIKNMIFNPDYVASEEEMANPNLAPFFNEDGTIKSEDEVDVIMDKRKKQGAFLGSEEYQQIKIEADLKLKNFIETEATSQIEELQTAVGDTIKGLNDQLKVYDVNFTDKTMSDEDVFARKMQNIETGINKRYADLNNRLEELTGYTFDNFDKAIEEAKTPEQKQNLQDLAFLYSNLNDYAKPFVKVANDSAILNRYSEELNSTLATLGLIMNYDDVGNIRGEYINDATLSVINNARVGWEFWSNE